MYFDDAVSTDSCDSNYCCTSSCCCSKNKLDFFSVSICANPFVIFSHILLFTLHFILVYLLLSFCLLFFLFFCFELLLWDFLLYGDIFMKRKKRFKNCWYGNKHSVGKKMESTEEKCVHKNSIPLRNVFYTRKQPSL